MGNTIFDPDLYRRTQEESRYLLRNLIAPPGPPPGAEKPKQEKPIQPPVTINVGNMPWETIASPGEQFSPETIAGLSNLPVPMVFPPIPRRRGFVAPPYEGAAPWREWNQPIRAPEWIKEWMKQYQPPLGPGQGRYRVEGGPWIDVPVEMPETPIPGRGQLMNIPGSAAGRMITEKIGGQEVTLPASAWADIYRGIQGPNETVQTPWGPVVASRARTPSPSYEVPIPPRFTIPSDVQGQMEDLMDIIKSPSSFYGARKRAAAAAALGDLSRLAAEQNRYQREMWATQMGIPLRERELAIQAAGIPIREREAETHRFAAEEMAKYYGRPVQITPGGSLVSQEGKVLFQSPMKPENTAGLWNDWFKLSHETDMFGRSIFNPMKAVWTHNMMFKNQPGFKPITIKDFDQSMVAPYIHQLLQQSPKTSKLKPESKEYQRLFEEGMRELYK